MGLVWNINYTNLISGELKVNIAGMKIESKSGSCSSGDRESGQV